MPLLNFARLNLNAPLEGHTNFARLNLEDSKSIEIQRDLKEDF
jgi:hypothetical protein